MAKKQTESQRIVKWNETRGLIKTPSDLIIENDMSFVIEEVIEAMTDLKSEDARPIAKLVSLAIRNGFGPDLAKFIKEEELDKRTDKRTEVTGEQIADACCDIKVFSTGTIRKAGYNPDVAMDEVQKEIDSRIGSIIDGKFTKDKSPEAQAKWYKADFTKAEI